MSLTLLSLVQQVVGEISANIVTPAAVASNTDQTVVQLYRLANRVGQDLVREYPWRRLVTEYTFPTLASTSEYDLPADFDRMVPDTHYDRTNDWQNRGPSSSQEWQWLNTGLSTTTQLRWRLYQNKIKFYSTPSAVYTMAFEYVSNLWVLADGGTAPTKSAFSLDTDTCVFHDDLMTTGLKYQWYRAKGLDFEPSLADFNRAKSMRQAQDIPEGAQSLSPRQREHTMIQEGNWSL